ncbi:MAG: TIGR03619 family F420-dependent LLM class oxidoreductase [Chloroflexi bacterium]|nr:TIGR03619 family F420-dependent LLM class oxidoreductase [Chloroflexota bacterium]
MRIGAQFPGPELPAEPSAIIAWARGAEALGFEFLQVDELLAYVDPAYHGDRWASLLPNPAHAPGPTEPFHEPFVLLGFLAAVSAIELYARVIILPQRQTLLVAKQAAEIDVLSGGRLRLGVAAGWNEIEQEAMGADFAARTNRFEEQIVALRSFWTEPVASRGITGEALAGIGVRPFPVQRPIPLWLGGGQHPRVLSRINRLADGWALPGHWLPDERSGEAITQVLMGREGPLGIEAKLSLERTTPADAPNLAGRWQDLGATHLVVGTLHAGFEGVDEHLEALESVASRLAAFRR